MTRNCIQRPVFLQWGNAAPLLAALCVAVALACPARGRAGDLPIDHLVPVSATAPGGGLPSTLIELDGTPSLSPDGGELTYEWRQLSGPKVELSNPTSAKPYFRTSHPGIYEFELVVEANGLKSEPHLVRLEIERENLPPVAKLVPEVWGQVGKALEIDGSQSFDPEGDKLTYRWRSLNKGLALPVAALDKPVLVFEPAVDGVFEIELVVSDGEKISPPAVCRISVKPRPKPPVARVEVKTMKATIPSVAAPPDLAAMSPPASSRFTPSPTPTPEMSAPVLPPPPAAPLPLQPDQPLPLTATLPNDLFGPGQPAARPAAPLTSTAPVAPPVVPGYREKAPVRQPPIARIEGPVVAKAGDMVMLDGRGSWSADGGRMEYLWKQKSGAFVNDFELVFDGSVERFKAPRPGDYEFELIVVDAGVESAPVLHRLKVVEQEDPPVAVVVAPTRAMPGALIKMDATQSYDLAGSPLVYRWRQTGGPAVKNYVIDETLGDAAPAFHPPTAGVYSFELIVSNGRLTSKPIEIDIEVGDARVPPKFTLNGLEAVSAGERISWDIAVSGDDARNYSFEWRQVEGPANAVLQAQGVRSLIMAPVPGRYAFEVTMKDRSGKAVSSSRRTLEVFKNGQANGSPTPLVQPPSPVQPATTRQHRVVPELTPLPNTNPPPPIAFPTPTPSRRPAQVLQK